MVYLVFALFQVFIFKVVCQVVLEKGKLGVRGRSSERNWRNGPTQMYRVHMCSYVVLNSTMLDCFLLR